MLNTSLLTPKTLRSDFTSALVVFFVALPLCLGVALASNAPLMSGVLAGIIGGIVVGTLSGSSTSVSGPSAGLTAIIASQIAFLGSLEAFLIAIILAGAIQILLSFFRMGFIAAFFPSSVIKGLLYAIGIILILKQIPHLLGHDADPFGDESFFQPNNENTFSELFYTLFSINLGAAIVGIFSLVFLFVWERNSYLKKSFLPGSLVVVGLSIILGLFFEDLGKSWSLYPEHLVQVPVADSLYDTKSFLSHPNWTVLKELNVYKSAITLALVASLETLLNFEAIEKIDPLQRPNPANRELFAQGVGNIFSGLVGGLPITSVIVRSSVNIYAGAQTKLSTIFHGFFILFSILFAPTLLNKIPLSALAAILIFTGLKLASPQIMMQMWREGKNQFLPFILTVVAIVLTDLLTGILIGLGIATCFILHSNIRNPVKKTVEKHAAGNEVLRVELANQVSFLNRASLEETLRSVPPGGDILIDATNTDYIDPDILDLINDFQRTSNIHNVSVSLAGFKDKYPQLEDRIHYVDFTSRELQANLTPDRVLEIFQEGNMRFRNGIQLTRDLGRRLDASSAGQFPMAVVLSCIDSRAPVEVVFDLTIGDIFSVRVAGNVESRKILGSIEYGCAVAGAKLVLIMGHTSCGAVKASFDFLQENKKAIDVTGCVNLDSLITEIQQSIDSQDLKDARHWSGEQRKDYLDELAYKNVLRTIRKMRQDSSTLDNLAKEGKIAIIGAMYNIVTAEVSFFCPVDEPKQTASKSPFRNFFKMRK